jgi:hypothetical protein
MASTPDMASPTTGSLLLQLPNELQDAICDLVAENVSRPVLLILINEDATTQRKRPQSSAFVVGGLSGTCRHLRRAFSAALERHIEVIMTRRQRNVFPRLMAPTKLHARNCRNADQALRIHVSDGPRKRRNMPAQKVHALATFIPIEDKLVDPVSVLVDGELLTPNQGVVIELAVIFVTDGSKSKLRACRRSIPISPQPPRERDPPTLWVAPKTMVALEEVKRAAKGTKWGARMRYYTLWFDYVVRFGPTSASKRRRRH